MDWNNDGKKDLITGEGSGHVRIYLNVNIDEKPVFNGYSLVEVRGVTFDAGTESSPFVVDWNNDGKKDLLVAEAMGKVHLLINTGSNADPRFDQAEYLLDGSMYLDPGSESSPVAMDWNNDGKKDLLVAEAMGHVYYYENKGTDDAPVFNGWKRLWAGGGELNVKDHFPNIDVADWDNDGVPDLISGCCVHVTDDRISKGRLWYFHAQGPLYADNNAISASTGGTIALNLKAGDDNSSRNYLIFCGITGTKPGTPLPGGYATLPINWDPFTSLALSLVNTLLFVDFMGTLDAYGNRQASFDTLGPVPPVAVGLVLSYAYALNGPWDYASNGLNVEIIP